MFNIRRIPQNPFLLPDNDNDWEACAAFNPSVAKDNEIYHLLYRAQSRPKEHHGHEMSVSSIGHATGNNGVHFSQRRRLIKPEHNWEIYGCEDPRITKLDKKYYIFYTALSKYPFEAGGIRIGLAITKDFRKIEAKHPITPFNSKAMALFPEKINGKYAAILTVHTDMPPAKIAIALFDHEEEMWSEEYWESWYANLESHVIPLSRSSYDHLEVGAQPIKTEHGWLLIYSYIQDYFSATRVFSINAVLLDLDNPLKVIGTSIQPVLIPQREYEFKGNVPNVIFPSGAILENNRLSIYYGATDTSCCMASVNVQELLKQLQPEEKIAFIPSKSIMQGFKRYYRNPIITPRSAYAWEEYATFNPAAIYEDGKVHLVYRAMSKDDTSVFGYASSKDGVHIDERLSSPIYVPEASFEQKQRPGNSGCEDPRITKMGDRFYMFYTAFNGYIPRVAFTSILIDDFLSKRWHWAEPKVITPPHVDDKDACLLPDKINGKYVIFHRVRECMCIKYVDNLNFPKDTWLEGIGDVIKPRKDDWDNLKFGIAAPPIATEYGWLLFFHRVSVPGPVYQVGALLLDSNDPTHVIAETKKNLLEPEMDYEKVGHVFNVVFPCGAVVINDEVYLYYGGADKVIGVAKMKLDEILKRLGV